MITSSASCCFEVVGAVVDDLVVDGLVVGAVVEGFVVGSVVAAEAEFCANVVKRFEVPSVTPFTASSVVGIVLGAVVDSVVGTVVGSVVDGTVVVVWVVIEIGC